MLSGYSPVSTVLDSCPINALDAPVDNDEVLTDSNTVYLYCSASKLYLWLLGEELRRYLVES